MEQRHLLQSIPHDKYDLITKDDAIQLYEGSLSIIKQMQQALEAAYEEICKNEQKSFLLEENVLLVNSKIFGRSSEKSKINKNDKKKSNKQKKKRVLLPSLRYPNLKVVKKEGSLETPPSCPCCQTKMVDSGMRETSESLHVIPKQYYIQREERVKYKCSKCHGAIETAPSIPKIKPGSSLTDEMSLDVTLSKYCDLIPIERYVQIAARSGVPGIPANTLYQCTHNVADFLWDVYLDIKKEVLDSKIIHADETTHKMLEGSDTKNWYLWGFSTHTACFYEAQDTRSGDIASDILQKSNCGYLVSDVYSGYAKAVRESNEYRKEHGLSLIVNIYCNAHARRKFTAAKKAHYEEEARLFLWCYRKIYRLENPTDDNPRKSMDFDKRRSWQRFYYKMMVRYAEQIKGGYSQKSSIVKAINYFLNNYTELTYFLDYEDIPIDNNSQERLMRSPVVGRKTWYGNHSPKGADTTAILFSIVETCKLNKVNPREYFKDIVHAIHEKRPIFTPANYKPLPLSE